MKEDARTGLVSGSVDLYDLPRVTIQMYQNGYKLLTQKRLESGSYFVCFKPMKRV